MKYLMEGINRLHKIIEAIDDIDKDYFDEENPRNRFKDNQIGYYHVEVGPYDDEYTFYPYSNQEEMKNINNVLNILKKDFSERCLELHKIAIDKLEHSIYSIKNNLKVEE